jgi:hypothetical protein
MIKKLYTLGIEESDSEEMMCSITEEIDNIMSQRSRMTALNRGDVTPIISHKDKIVVLYASLKDEDYHAGHALIALAQKLGYKIFYIPKPESIRSRPESFEDFATGVLISVADFDQQVRLSTKSNEYENGRTFVRSLQVKGLFNDTAELGLESLKRDHRFFGNNPGEVESLDKRQIPVTPWEHMYEPIFREDDPMIYKIFLSLAKRSHALLEEGIRERLIADHLLSFSEMTQLYMTRRVATENSRSRTAGKQKLLIPHKPRSVATLVRGEYDIICQYSTQLFQNPGYCRSADSWISRVKSVGFKVVKTELSELYNRRGEFLEKYASLTTKRLQEMRETSHLSKNKRKRDITIEDVVAMINARADPVTKFVSELVSLDPRAESLFREYVRGEEAGNEGFSKVFSRAQLTQDVKKRILEIPEYLVVLKEKKKISPEGYLIDSLGNYEKDVGRAPKIDDEQMKNRFAILGKGSSHDEEFPQIGSIKKTQNSSRQGSR